MICTYNKDNVLSKIDYSKKLYQYQKKKVEEEQYIQNLLFEDYVSNVKSNLSRYDYLDTMFEESSKELNNRSKKDRKNIDNLTSMIAEDFFNNKEIKITNILQGGFEGYNWRITVNFEKKEFAICIPIMNNISIDNFEFADCGRFKLLLRTDEYSWDVLSTTYRIEDISEVIKNFHDNFEMDASR